jgi:hypothetical protein
MFSALEIAALGVRTGPVRSKVTERDEAESLVAPLMLERTVIAFVPAVSVAVVQLHAPVEVLAVQAFPLETPSTRIWMEVPPIAVPVNVGVESLVRLSELLVPKSDAVSRSGAEGAVRI